MWPSEAPEGSRPVLVHFRPLRGSQVHTAANLAVVGSNPCRVEAPRTVPSHRTSPHPAPRSALRPAPRRAPAARPTWPTTSPPLSRAPPHRGLGLLPPAAGRVSAASGSRPTASAGAARSSPAPTDQADPGAEPAVVTEPIFGWPIDTPVHQAGGEAIGAGSMCWEHPQARGVFDSQRARRSSTSSWHYSDRSRRPMADT